MSETWQIFAPLQFEKIVDMPDGSIQVYGRATQEVPDSANEILDFDTSIPYLQKRSEEMLKSTDNRNAFPLRRMHQNSVAGKEISFDINPAEKAVDCWLEVDDPIDVMKVKKRDYMGLSLGGRYIKRWPDKSGKYVRYTGDPLELSLVDRPAVPTAKINFFKADDLELSDKPEWYDGFIEAADKAEIAANILQAFQKAQQDDKDATIAKLKAIGERAGIPRRDGEPLTPPKDYPTDPNEYGDPANWTYPCDESRAGTAVGYFNGGNGAEKYTPSARANCGRRIARLASRFGAKYEYDSSSKKITRKDKKNAMANDSELRKISVSMAEIGQVYSLFAKNKPDFLPQLAKLDVGNLVRQLKAYKQAALDQVSKDDTAAKDALSMLINNIDSLDLSEPMDTSNPGSQVKDPSTVIKAAAAVKPADAATSATSSSPSDTATTESSTTEPAKKAAGAQAVGGATTTTASSPSTDLTTPPPQPKGKKNAAEDGTATTSSTASSPSSTDNTDAYKKLEAKVDQTVDAVNKLAEALTKMASGQSPASDQHTDAPIKNLNGILSQSGVAGFKKMAAEDPIIKALMDDDNPYRWLAAVKAAGGDDPLIGPARAERIVFQKINEATAASLEEGGVVTMNNPFYKIKLYESKD